MGGPVGFLQRRFWRFHFCFFQTFYLGSSLRQILKTDLWQCGPLISWLAYISSGGNLPTSLIHCGKVSNLWHLLFCFVCYCFGLGFLGWFGSQWMSHWSTTMEVLWVRHSKKFGWWLLYACFSALEQEQEDLGILSAWDQLWNSLTS